MQTEQGSGNVLERVAETLSGTEYKNCTVQLSSVLERGRGFLFMVLLPSEPLTFEIFFFMNATLKKRIGAKQGNTCSLTAIFPFWSSLPMITSLTCNSP